MCKRGRPLAISKELAIEYARLCRTGMTKVAAAKELGYSEQAFRSALKRFNIVVTRTTLEDRIAERIDEIKGSNKPQAFWAKEFGVSQVSVCRAFRSLNISTFAVNHPLPGPRVNFENRVAEFRMILEYIQSNGGYVPWAIKALGLKTPPQLVREFAKTIAFDLTLYQFAWQDFGLWLTLPGPWVKTPPHNYLVPAICKGCGKLCQINLANAKTGRTSGCINCRTSHKRTYKVRDASTGQIYKSIMDWAKAVPGIKYYQKYRLILLKDKSIVISGNKYDLIELLVDRYG